MGKALVALATAALIAAAFTGPYLATVAEPIQPEEYVHMWFIALKIDGGYVNTSLVKHLMESVDLSAFTYVFGSGGKEYLIYRSPYSPYLVIEAYNDGGAAVITLHYVPKEEALLWWASPCGQVMQCDFAFTNLTAIKEAASKAGWAVLGVESRTYQRCATVTPSAAAAPCVEVTEASIVMMKNISGGFVEAKIFSSYSPQSMPWSDIMFLTNNPGPEASEAVKELVKALIRIDYEPSWSPPTITQPDIGTAKHVLAVEAAYLARLGVLSTGGLSADDVYSAAHEIRGFNQTIEITQDGGTRIVSDYSPPNPLSIADEINTWPCTPYLGALHPYCAITTTVPNPTTSATTTSESTTSSTISATTNTWATGSATYTGTSTGSVGETPPAAWPRSHDLLYLAVALALALVAAGVTSVIVRRY